MLTFKEFQDRRKARVPNSSSIMDNSIADFFYDTGNGFASSICIWKNDDGNVVFVWDANTVVSYCDDLDKAELNLYLQYYIPYVEERQELKLAELTNELDNYCTAHDLPIKCAQELQFELATHQGFLTEFIDRWNEASVV